MRTILFLLAGAATAAAAQHAPYAGQHERDIKALSVEEVAQYRSGAGMGYAKSAELNHFPGPMHALELADRLGLDAQQREAAQRLMASHKAEARALGAEVVQAEADVEALFRSGSVDAAALKKAVERAGALQAEYRLSHLETHRRMRSLLSAEQVARYDEARGYAAGRPAHRH